MDLEQLEKVLLDIKIKYLQLNISGFDFEFTVKLERNRLILGKNNSGSTVEVWSTVPNYEDQFIYAWIDSEGAFYEPIADNLEDFFNLLFYLNGFVYDTLFKIDAFKNYPEIFKNPKESLSDDQVDAFRSNNYELHPFLKDFRDYLEEKQFVSKQQKSPVEIILNSTSEYSSFSEWYKSNQFER